MFADDITELLERFQYVPRHGNTNNTVWINEQKRLTIELSHSIHNIKEFELSEGYVRVIISGDGISSRRVVTYSTKSNLRRRIQRAHQKSELYSSLQQARKDRSERFN